MPRLFGRRVYVELGVEGGAAARYEGLRVTFDVEASDGSEPNKAAVEVYGVSRRTLAQAQADGAFIRLFAGYESTGGARLLFQGQPIAGGVKLDRRGPERVLVVEAQDGGTVYRTSRLTQSWTAGTSSGQVFDALAEALGVPLGNVVGAVRTVSFPHGISLVGPARQQLDRLAAISGARWTIRDGALQVWSVGSSTGESAVLFSAEAGNLIGSPAPTDDGVEVTALLAPTIRPGKPFRLESEDYQGDYVATTVRFRGDSGFDTDFYVVARGTPL